MKKISKEKMILVSNILVYLLGLTEVCCFVNPYIFGIILALSEKQTEKNIDILFYCCVISTVIVVIFLFWSCYYLYLYERKEEKEVKIKVKPYKVKGVYSSFDEIYKRIYNELTKKKSCTRKYLKLLFH